MPLYQISSRSVGLLLNYGDLTSAILDLLCAYLDNPRQTFGVFFITVQNLIGIDAVVSIISKC